MARLKFLPLLLLVGLFSVHHVSSTENEAPCPEHCQCTHIQRYGTHIKCSEISRTQSFQDPVVSFILERAVSEPAEPLQLSTGFFLDFGNSFKHVDFMLITVDIEKIDIDAFQGLDSLSHLIISNNSLTYIHSDTFLNNTQLRKLILSKNPLTFDEYILNHPYLEELDLSFCQIRNLSENAFVKVNQLDFLNLESNLIDTIHPRTFEPLLSLEELKLSNNKLQTLSPDLFLKNDGLTSLHLSYNPLASIENLKLLSIHELQLQHCNFTELNSMSFSAYISINSLNLSGNSIERLSPETFSKLENLAYLDISNNKLGSLDSRLFLGNQELETLSLRDNPTMSFWPEEGFQGQFKQLHLLDISNTGIESLALGSLKNMSDLAQLDLSRNALKGFEKGVLPRSIKVLSLANNNITSINIINLLNGHQVREQESILLEKHTGEQKIMSPRQLNLPQNKLQKIVPGDWNEFPTLRMLDIRGNPLECNEDLDILINYLRNTSIKPGRSFNVGNIDDNFEMYNWADIRTKNCDSLSKSPQETIENNVPQKTDLPPEINTVSTDDLELISYDTDYQDIVSNDQDFEYDTNNYETTRVPHHKTVLTPQIVEVSDTSPVVVAFLSALVLTLIITLMLALLTTVCKQRLLNGIVIRKRPHRVRSSSYRHLHDNEQVNLPTTPIVKVKTRSPDNGFHAKNESYTCNVP